MFTRHKKSNYFSNTLLKKKIKKNITSHGVKSNNEKGCLRVVIKWARRLLTELPVVTFGRTFKLINTWRKHKPHLHYRTGVGALLWLALADEEGPVTSASQHFLGLTALDVTHVPGTLIVVGRVLILLQRVRAGLNKIKAADMQSRQAINKTLSSNHSLNDRWRSWSTQ